MSGYGGRRAPNVTQYLNTLNAEPPIDDSLLDDDISLFTNAQFNDYDADGRTVDYSKTETDQTATSGDADITSSPMGDLSTNLDFMQDLSFPSADFAFPQTPASLTFSDGIGFPSLQHSVPFAPTAHQQAPFVQEPTSRAGDKRKRDVMPNRPLTVEEEARIAAEEDKRRRNTAASARFRIKKKQREQALEKHSKEMSQKVVDLERKIQELETENKWLKGMILEKNGGNEQTQVLMDGVLHPNTQSVGDSKDKKVTSEAEAEVKEE